MRATSVTPPPAITGAGVIDRALHALAGGRPGNGAVEGPHVVLTLASGSVTISRVAASGAAALVGDAIAIADGWTAVAERLSRDGLDRRTVVLRLGAGDVLLRTITLPATVADVVAPVLRNQIGQYTPWPEDAVSYGYVVLTNSATADTIAVRLAATDGRRLDAVLDAMRESGIVPCAVDVLDCEPTERPIVVHRLTCVAPARTKALATVLAAGMVAAVTVGAFGWAEWRARSVALANIETSTASLAQAVRSLATPDGGTTARPQAYRELLDRRRTTEPVVLTLERIATALPDTAWLDGLTIADDRVVLRGQAQDAAALIAALEAPATGLTGVAFDAPTLHDAQTARQRFSIAGRITHPTLPEARP